MLKYKVLYKKMMDDLKDAGMWIDWAQELKNECPDVAQYLLKSATYRIESSYPETMKLFEHISELDKEKNGHCMNELIHEQLECWHDELVMKMKKIK